jgi:hypothetical protein
VHEELAEENARKEDKRKNIHDSFFQFNNSWCHGVGKLREGFRCTNDAAQAIFGHCDFLMSIFFSGCTPAAYLHCHFPISLQGSLHFVLALPKKRATTPITRDAYSPGSTRNQGVCSKGESMHLAANASHQHAIARFC